MRGKERTSSKGRKKTFRRYFLFRNEKGTQNRLKTSLAGLRSGGLYYSGVIGKKKKKSVTILAKGTWHRENTTISARGSSVPIDAPAKERRPGREDIEQQT